MLDSDSGAEFYAESSGTVQIAIGSKDKKLFQSLDQPFCQPWTKKALIGLKKLL